MSIWRLLGTRLVIPLDGRGLMSEVSYQVASDVPSRETRSPVDLYAPLEAALHLGAATWPPFHDL